MSSTTTEQTTPLTESGKYYVVKEEIIDGVKVITREKLDSKKVYYEKNRERICRDNCEKSKTKYATDPEYREKRKAMNRESYRKKVEKKRAEEEAKKKLTESV